MPSKPSTKSVALRLDDETIARLKKLGEEKDRTPHYMMKEAVERYLDKEEELAEEVRITRERWEEYCLTGEGYSQAEMEEWAEQFIHDRMK
jgi:predicted transcriptional regulator